jgi:hypothetical protein
MKKERILSIKKERNVEEFLRSTRDSSPGPPVAIVEEIESDGDGGE